MRDIVITSSILILAIFIIRYLAKGKIHPILQYALWLPVVLRLMMPVPLWNSQFSILNYFPESLMQRETAKGQDFWAGADGSIVYQPGMNTGIGIQNQADADADTSVPYQTATDKDISDTAADLPIPSLTNDTQTDIFPPAGNGIQGESSYQNTNGTTFLDSLHNILFYLWIAGIIVTGGYMLFYQMKWKRYLQKMRKPLKGMETYRGLSVYTVKGLPSPCLCGRCIYLTKEMSADEKRLNHILVHEYCHYKHLDSLWVVVRCILTIVYWFNPLVWAAAHASKQDSELACDEASIRLLGEDERIAYGKTLLRLIAGEEQERNRMGVASTMSGEEEGIRERIFRIARKRKYAALAAVGVVLLAATLILVTFSGAGKEDTAINTADESTAGNEAQSEEALEQMKEQLEKEVEALAQEKELAQKQAEETKKQMVESEAEKAALQEQEAVLTKLSSYDARIDVLGSQGNVYGIYDAKIPRDYVQAYYEKGEEALDEDIYQLEKVKGADGSDITIYGMYTKEYGCRGIKILIGDDVNDFDEPWLVSGMHGLEENIRVYESAQDGLPRTFACRMNIANTSSTEIWRLYLCDRYDTGTIDLYQLEAQDYMEQINKRMRFEIAEAEKKIVVYDNEKRIGEIEIPASEAAVKEIKRAALDASMVSFELGAHEDELKLMIGLGIQLNGIDEIWYHGLPIISFPITCGSMGAREFHLGEASIESDYVNAKKQSQPSIDELCVLPLADNSESVLEEAFKSEEGHYDVAVTYCNPCPSYTRISDTFGERTNPVTREKRMHNGVDLAASAGADIVAAADGTVYQTGYDVSGGNYVALYHELNGEFTYYMACQDILVSEGEKVTAGQKIATVGSTGRSTGYHLHFAVSRDGEYIEPVFEEF